MTIPKHPRDRIQSILSAILPTMVVAISITMQPGLVQGMVDFVGVGEVQAGYIASAEVMGLMAGTVVFAFFATLYCWRRVMAGALVLLVLANILTIAVGSVANLMPLRAAAGFGAGLVTAVGFASLANTMRPGRNYGWLIACVIGFSAIGFALLPAIFGLGGYNALISIYTVMVVISLIATRYLTSDHEEKPESNAGLGLSNILSTPGLLSLSSVLLFFIGYTSAWTYMSLIGRDAGLNDTQIASVLSTTQFFGVAGALSISFLSERMRHRWLAITIYGIGVLGLFALNLDLTFAVFLGLNAIFQFCWNAGQPLLLAIIASRQRTGELLRFAIPLQFIGMGIAPSIAATVLSMSGGYSLVIVFSGLAAIASSLAIAPFILKLQRKPIEATHVV